MSSGSRTPPGNGRSNGRARAGAPCVLDAEGDGLLPQQERFIKKQAGSSEARLMPMRTRKMPPRVRPLCFRESTGVHEGKDEEIRKVFLRFGRKRRGSDG